MAARTARPTRPTTEGNKPNTARKAQHNDFWQSLRTFIHSQQCQLIVGILLLFIALMLLIAYVRCKRLRTKLYLISIYMLYLYL